MASIEDIRAERIKKIGMLREAGMEPYPNASFRTHKLSDVRSSFTYFTKSQESLIVAGRVMSLRAQGGIAFVDLYDGTGRFQVVIQKEQNENLFDLFIRTVDASDFIEVTGVAYTTKRGEPSVLAASWRMLAKSLRPVPDEWFGLKDEDERYRKRYLDFLLNPTARDLVEKRSKFWRAIRRFHEDHGFIEVHTPILEVTTGGGDANAFATHHDALDLDVFLRISVGELWQKRLIVAGFPKVFEIGRNFRNEGMSAEHAQEYEQCEAYWAYSDFYHMHIFLRECYQFAAQETFGTLAFSIRGFEVNLAGEWPTIDYAEEVKRQTGVDIWTATDDELRSRLHELGTAFEDGAGRVRLIDTLWKHCRKTIGGPVILINEPTITSPLAKMTEPGARTVERFHFVIAGSELGQGYSELNDPLDQRTRFEEQQALREAGDPEAQMADWDFVEALEYGMPPTGGHGFSERTFAFLAGVPLREAQLFPLMRPRL